MIVVRKKTDTGWWQGEMSATGTVSVKVTEFYKNSVKSFHDLFFKRSGQTRALLHFTNVVVVVVA